MPSFLLHRPPVRLCTALACVLLLWNAGAFGQFHPASGIKGEAKREKAKTFPPTGITVSGIEGVQKEKDKALLGPTGSVLTGEKKEEGLVFLASTELPARSVDLSALNLTELVNRMLSRALKESRRFFSLLSISSYSSFAFHKVSVAVYNVSNLKTVDPAKFPMRFCYCLNNRTNDVSDFTALLVDMVENSTGSLTEVFRSTSLLSVSHTDESDCIFICMMAGKAGRNLSDFWEMAEKSPVINYTFTSSVSGVLGAATRETTRTSKPITQVQQMLWRTGPAHPVSALGSPLWRETATNSVREPTERTEQLPTGTTATWRTAPPTLPALATRRVTGTPRVTTDRQTWASKLSTPRAQAMEEKTPGGPPWETLSSTPTSAEAQQARSTQRFLEPAGITARPSSPAQSSPTSGMVTASTQTLNPTKAPAPKDLQTGEAPAEWPPTPGKQPAPVPAPLQASRCPHPLFKEGAMTAAPITLAMQKLNPCLMELCRFLQRCLCGSRRKNPTTETTRYCLEYYSWFLKNATSLCQKVKSVSNSHTLKQKCLESVCQSV